MCLFVCRCGCFDFVFVLLVCCFVVVCLFPCLVRCTFRCLCSFFVDHVWLLVVFGGVLLMV